MKSCDFCSIIQKAMPVSLVYEDDWSLAFMDKHPIRPGHILVIPKEHESDLHKLGLEPYNNLMQTVRLLSQKIEVVYEPRKVGLVVAGFDVPHAHIHIVPMREYHDISSQAYMGGEWPTASNGELESEAEKIRKTL